MLADFLSIQHRADQIVANLLDAIEFMRRSKTIEEMEKGNTRLKAG